MVTLLEITRSRLRQKILSYFFTNQDAHLYLRETASLLRDDPGNLSKELAKLIKEGIFVCDTRGRQKYFSLNKTYPLYKELKSIIFKTIGVEGSLKELVQSVEGISGACIYGSFAVNKAHAASDIDLLIIGNPDENVLMHKLDALEKRLQREINYNIYSEHELKARIKKRDSFMLNILKRPHILLKGNLNGIQ